MADGFRDATPEQMKVYQAFFDAGANMPMRARTLDELGIENTAVVQEMIAAGLIRSPLGDSERFYAGFLSRSFFNPPWMRRFAFLAFAVAALVIIALLIIGPRPR